MSRRARNNTAKKNNSKLVILVVVLLAIIAVLGVILFTNNKGENGNVGTEQAQNKVENKPTPTPEPTEEPEYIDESIQYENEYEEAILKRTNKNNDYKVIEIKGSKYHGYLTAIYEPSRIGVVATNQIGKAGEWLVDMSARTKSLVGVNAGGFADANFNGDGGTPLGITISDGKVLTESKYGGSYGVVGFDKNDKLVIGKFSLEQAKEKGLRDAVTFGPFLISDGKDCTDFGTAALGRASRTSIGQREDGIVLLLVLDGDRTKGEGAVYKEEQEIMKKYGAVNAANLDGGTSSCMTVHSSLVNDPTSMSGEHRTREIATAFILKPDEKDNGDYKVVESKVK